MFLPVGLLLAFLLGRCALTISQQQGYLISGFPAYFNYTVDLEIDGEPIRLSRVILCTGETYQPFGEAQNLRTFASPGVIGAWTGENSAIYVNAPDICTWAAGRESRGLDPDHVPIIVRANDTRDAKDMDVFVSRRVLASGEYGVRFVSSHAEKATKADFQTSEEEAAEGPDLTALISAYQKCGFDRGKSIVVNNLPAVSHAFLIEKAIWSKIPSVVEWVSAVPDGAQAVDVPGDVSKALRDSTPFRNYWGQRQSLYYGGGLPTDFASEDPRLRFSSDWAHPAYVRSDFLEIDLTRRGLFGAQRGTREVMDNLARLHSRGTFEDFYQAVAEDGKLLIDETDQLVYVVPLASFLTTRSDAMLFGGDTADVSVAGAIRDDYCGTQAAGSRE